MARPPVSGALHSAAANIELRCCAFFHTVGAWLEQHRRGRALFGVPGRVRRICVVRSAVDRSIRRQAGHLRICSPVSCRASPVPSHSS